MAQLPQGLGFDLPDPLTSHFEVLADFLQRVIGTLSDPKPLPQHLLLARCERLQRAVDLASEIVPNRRSQRRKRLFVLDAVAQMAVLFLPDRGPARTRFRRYREY